MRRLALVVALMVSLCGWQRSVAAGPVLNPEDGHYYEAVSEFWGLTWEAARLQASLKTFTAPDGTVYEGHLAVIGSAQTNSFVTSSFPGAAKPGGYWLGGFQEPGSPEPGGGWRWITDEPFSCPNWAPGEPSDGGASGVNEDAVHLTNSAGQWNDLRRGAKVGGYIVEYEAVNGPPNGPPIADAGGPYAASTAAVDADVKPDTLNIKSKGKWVTAYLVVDPGGTATVQLDGSASSDPDGDLLSFAWIVRDSAGQEVASTHGIEPTVELPAGAFSAELVVSDGQLNSGPATASITVEVLDLATVDPASITLHGPADGPAATGEWADLTDGETLMVKFSRASLIATCIPGQVNAIIVGGVVQGEDAIRIIGK